VLATREGVTEYPWVTRGSDERQYGAPGVDLPVASIMRSKYTTYPEYHTSLDDLSLITPLGLEDALGAYIDCVEALEANRRYRATVLGEPQLSPRNLYPDISVKGGANAAGLLMHCLTYADGDHDLVDVATICRAPVGAVAQTFALLEEHRLVERV
jgi:aminopeptidase-like protein